MPYDTADFGVAPYPQPSGGGRTRTAGKDMSAQVASQVSYGQGFGARVVNAFRYLVSGVSDPQAFFGPQQPLLPTAQEPAQGAVGRRFDYPSGFNTRTLPRGEEGISFATLKGLADGYDLLRTIIETRKDQIANSKWTIGPKDKDKDRDSRCDMLEAFWNSPDKTHDWAEWIRMVLEQVLVLDAPALYCELDRAGRMYSLNVLDGALIKRNLTLDGRTPRYDEGPAYQEIIKGLPAVDYIVPPPFGEKVMNEATGFPMPELIYRPRNIRVDRVYGFSPVEQIITTVNISLNRQLSQLSYYTAGSTPDLIMGVPDTWNPDQIAQFQSWWDSLLLGNIENKRGAKFIPGGIKPFDTKERALMDQYDEWLARICCFAFSMSPTAFTKQTNRATADSEKERGAEEGILPWLEWVSALVAYVNRVKFGIDDLVLRWNDDESIAPKEQAEIDVMYVNSKVYHPDEIRQRRGHDPMAPDMRLQMDMANYNSAPNASQLPPEQQAAADDRAKLAAEHAASLQPVAVTPQEKAKAKAEEKAEFATLVKQLQTPAPSIHVAAPAVTVTTPDVHVTNPITVNTPDIKAPDVFVDVGATTMQAKFDMPKAKPIHKTVTATRGPNGELIGTISDSPARTVRATRDADGNLVAKVE